MTYTGRLRAPTVRLLAEREHALTVACPDPGCEQPPGAVCIDRRDGAPLQGPPAHALRIRAADRAHPDHIPPPPPETEEAVVDTIRSQPCSHCRAPIVWARTSRGEWMPVDAEPVETGNVLLATSDGRVHAGVLGRTQAMGARESGQRLHQHHRLSCPHVGKWHSRRSR